MRWLRDNGWALSLLALIVVAILFYRYEPVRTQVVNSACARDASSDECQAIFANSIRNFDAENACLLAHKLSEVSDLRLIGCDERN